MPDDVADLRVKKAKGWGRYHAYKKILRHHTSRRHRLHLVESCILQAVLWMANTWKPSQQICRELRGFHLAVLRAVFPRPPGPRPEGCHPNTHHSRWIIDMLREEKRHLADTIFLQRFHRWAGHLARTTHSPLRQIIVYRDGEWWHRQHLSPWGIRHEGDRGNFQRWDQSLSDLYGVNWKEAATNRASWKKTEADLILLFQKPARRPREDTERGKNERGNPRQSQDCQVPQMVSARGSEARKPNKKTNKKRAQVTQLVSTLQDKYKRKHTRQGGVLKEYLVPLGPSSECALGRKHTKSICKKFEAEVARRKASTTWSRALSAIQPHQPLLDLVILPLAGHLQGGIDVFGTTSGLGKRPRSARDSGGAKSSRRASGKARGTAGGVVQ